MEPLYRRSIATALIVSLTGSQAAWAATAPVTGIDAQSNASGGARSPIRHLIVVSGENRGFDHVFATYTPPDPNQTIWNLLSRGIVGSGGKAGSNFLLAEQQQAYSADTFELSPAQTGPFKTLPQPNTTLNALPAGPCILSGLLYSSDIFCSDPGIDPAFYDLLSIGGSGQAFYYPSLGVLPAPDCRYPSAMPNAPYSIVGASVLNACGAPFLVPEITPVQFSSHTGDPVHRFYQMWQQSDCSASHASADNPSGCKSDLYTWVATSVGWDITKPPTTDQDTYQGGVAMGYYDMAQGDWPYFKSLADNFAISDNYHQPVMGGTGANSQFMLTGDVYYRTNAKGRPAQPSADLIENPNPVTGTNNYYTNDAFGKEDGGSTGVGFTNCSDETQPGVKPIMDYLHALPYRPFRGGNCAPGTWYQVNNDYPYYNTDGSVISAADKNAFPGGPAYSIGPQIIPTIGDKLSRRSISWKYYGEGMSVFNQNPPKNQLYCAICNGFQYSKSIMTSRLRKNLVDLDQFYADVAASKLPAVSFIKPDILLDGHPGTSTPALFEAFIQKLVETVQANESLWRDTAILITFDEAGGYYDSGYIQPIDFFGDGPRTVMIAVSRYAKKGHIDHTYADHASILKFIEWNWGLQPLSKRSRDNLPNPVTLPETPYFPVNSPAIGDLRTLFDFRNPSLN
ncbi:MAG: alkaline phosphatase family protein [Methylococcus sp.]|nr:alkaline phosphatase family protein [Methylococcus sp.]